MANGYGFSHVGVATHQMDTTIQFYEGLLGFPRVVEDLTRVSAGGAVRLVYFDVGDQQFIVFMESKNVPGIPADYDTGINGALGLPRGLYHYSFKLPSLEDLECRRIDLESKGIEVTPILDLRYAKAIFFFDPNGIQLEFCCQIRPFEESDLHQQSEVRVSVENKS
jgi:catechol 2,3-dioxygenase-like lactoylglutathione lyase family enzyme